MAGLVLIGLGIAGLLLGRFSYTTQKNVIDVGPITASVDEKHSVDVPDIAGISAILAGGLLIFLGRKTA
jgi:xanthosine utilization system XapX-like protein